MKRIYCRWYWTNPWKFFSFHCKLLSLFTSYSFIPPFSYISRSNIYQSIRNHGPPLFKNNNDFHVSIYFILFSVFSMDNISSITSFLLLSFPHISPNVNLASVYIYLFKFNYCGVAPHVLNCRHSLKYLGVRHWHGIKMKNCNSVSNFIIFNILWAMKMLQFY